MKRGGEFVRALLGMIVRIVKAAQRFPRERLTIQMHGDHLIADLNHRRVARRLIVGGLICECVVAVLLGGGPPGSAPVTLRDSGLIWPLRRVLLLTCPWWLPAPAWPTSWLDQKHARVSVAHHRYATW